MTGVLNSYLSQEKPKRMSLSDNSISTEAMQSEWLEIQAAQKNPALFRPLYKRYFEAIFRFIYRRTADEHLASDICSQVFLKAMQKLSSYEFRGVPFSAWLYRIASNEVMQHFRHASKNRVVSVDDANLSEMMEELGELDNSNAIAKMLELIDGLPEQNMRLIEMRFFEKRPFKEIAAILDITESNAKVKTYRILERLRKKIVNST